MSSLEHMRRAALEYSIGRAAIFSGLPPEDVRAIASYASLRTIKRDEYLFREGDPVVGFFILRQGLINVHKLAPGNQEQIIHLLRPGESFAERAMTSSKGYPANARAVTDSEVILIPAEPFRSHQRKRPDLAWSMLSSMSHHLRNLVSTIECLKFRDFETRLIHWMLQRCPSTQSRQPVDLVLGMTKGELAAELATRRETLSRTFRRLRTAGHIEVRPQSITIIDPRKLQSLFARRSAPEAGE